MKSMTETMSQIIKDSKYKITFFGQDFLVLVVNSILGGFFIGLSGFMFQKTMLLTGDVLAGAAMLSVGFLLCDAFWSDIFSNNFLYAMAAYEKRMNWKAFIYSTLLVTFFNILGIVAFITCLCLAGSIDGVEHIALNEITMKINNGYIPILFKGILGSVCICVGTFTAQRTDSVLEKALSIICAVFAMHLCGFEHATVDLYLFLACPMMEALLFIPKLIVVYIGNVIGGLIFAGLFALEIDVTDDE